MKKKDKKKRSAEKAAIKKKKSLDAWIIRVRENTQAGYRNQCNLYDKYLITLASGSFGISFAFVDKFISTFPPKNPLLLSLSWMSFALCISIALINFLISQQAFRSQLSHDQKIYNMRIKGCDTKDLENEKSKITITTILFNYLSMSMYLIGNILLIIFVMKNLKG